MAASLLLLLLPLLGGSSGEAHKPRTPVREYFIAAVEIGWDYIYVDDADPGTEQRKKSKDTYQKFIKAVYREYVDSTYTVPKPRPPWTGIQGPVIVAQAGDRVVVHFKNLASQPYSISPVGITYGKQSEGAGYDDSTEGQEKNDDAVFPGGYYEYVWDISPNDGPTTNDPECLTYSYSSQVDTVRDVNSGLIGALLICTSSAFTAEDQRRNQAFVLLFAVFDETKSWYGAVGERRSREKFKRGNSRKEYHTINGYINSTLPGLKICEGRNSVIWHLIGMGTAPAIHSIQFQDHTLEVLTHRKVTMDMTPLTFITAEMRATTPGNFLISCQIHAHRHDGMNALFTVEKCPEPVVVPGPELRNVKHDDYDNNEDYMYDNYDDMFNAIHYQPMRVQVRSSRREKSKVWNHYIAIEEVTWDYTHHLKNTGGVSQSQSLPAAPHHLDYRYKKAVYVEYTDSSFTTRKDSADAPLGPLLKGKINDEIHITLRNLASRPYNIYPNGLSKVSPMQTFTNAAGKDLHSFGVAPNETFGYIWRIKIDDGPLNGDPQCLIQLYQSTVSPERDLASGLVGTLLICKNEAIDTRGRLFGPDEEWRVIFAVFDENISWYMKENMKNSRQNSTGITDSEFYNSNVIYSVNGIMFGGRQFVICKTDVAFLHVASVSTQSDFISVYFTGNLFEYQGLYQSVLTLFPMTGVTVSMEPEVIGEWEISAFDVSLKNRGMSVKYTVRLCDKGDIPRVDYNREDDDISDYLDLQDQPIIRSLRAQNRNLVQLCKKLLTNNSTQSVNIAGQNVTDDKTTGTAAKRQAGCPLKGGEEPTAPSEGGIPQDILKELDSDKEGKSSLNETVQGEKRAVRERRQVEDPGMDVDFSARASDDGGTRLEIQQQVGKTRTDDGSELKAEKTKEMSNVNNGTTEDLDVNNKISLNNSLLLSKIALNVKPTGSGEMDQKYIRSEPENHHIIAEYNASASNNSGGIGLSVEYDDYSLEQNSTLDLSDTDYINARSGGTSSHHYHYIAAEEITWDYGIRKPHQFITSREMQRGMRKFLPEYKKVVFRAYKNEDFSQPLGRGELDQHLGILGPFIRTEINDVLTVIFKNKASRPYSFHLHGIYDRSQGAGTAQTHSSSAPPGVPGEPVAPGEARTYNWKVTRTQGPTTSEFDCKTGAYYSTVDKERDLHSGLIGPLVICKSGTLNTQLHTQPRVQEFSLLFHTFDETKSWYMGENLRQHCAPPCRANLEDPWYHTSNKFAAINGYVAETLPGLLLAQHQLVRWHLLNVGNGGEYHAIHFHGLPFTVHTKEDHRMGVYNLFPGVFGTVEMRPPTVGTWLVECTIGDYQMAGMRAKLLVYHSQCIVPLGMKSGRIEDSQITASDYKDSWKPKLARLDKSGKVNAWMGNSKTSWLQVDLLKPTLLHGVQTQGVRSRLWDYYITFFTVAYSLDQDTWSIYRGNRGHKDRVFFGNMDSTKVKDNYFIPPFVARYVRIRPLDFKLKPSLRLELLGCDLNSCSFPLGLQIGPTSIPIPDSSFSASSFYSFMFMSWIPSLARLHQGGIVNAWRPKSNNPHEWLQVDLGKVKRITGVVTQGARSAGTHIMVTEFSITYSHDGHTWSSVLEENTDKIFQGNNDYDEEAFNYFEPPIFGRYLRIHPLGWINDIALRLEILGCDTTS